MRWTTNDPVAAERRRRLVESWRATPRWIFVLLGGAVALLFAIEAVINNAPAPSPAISTTVAELEAAYADQEVAAQLRFGDKPVAVTGIISGISLDAGDDVVLLFAGEGMDVRVGMNERAREQVGRLRMGQQVTVVCNTVGEVLGNPTLDDCFIPAAT